MGEEGVCLTKTDYPPRKLWVCYRAEDGLRRLVARFWLSFWQDFRGYSKCINASAKKWQPVTPRMFAGLTTNSSFYFTGSSPAAFAILGNFCISEAIRGSGFIP